MSAPRVFISYAQHSPQHSARVLELAEALREHGIDADLDQLHRHELLDWPRWCQEQLQPDRTDWVLMVCSKPYRDRIENRVDPHTGKGASWEGALIDDQLYEAKGNDRFVPVLLDDESENSIPAMVRGWTWFRVQRMDFTDPGFTDLYRLLTRQPAIALPPLGRRADLHPDRAAQDEPPVCPRPADAGRPGHPPVQQGRAVRLLQAYFADDDERTRRTLVNLAFGDCERDPRPAIQYTGSAMVFADHLVDTLLKHGCAGRGRHSLSLLIEAMGNARGRRTDPDYAELPQLLDGDCTLPTRDEELHYLRDLVSREEEIARLYSPLLAIAESQPENRIAPLLSPWRNHKDIALLLHQPRPSGADREADRAPNPRQYDDILAAFGDVEQAALLGAPGAGKSTTLRKLAVDKARRALENPAEPLPLFTSLGFWSGDEDVSAFLAAQVPEIGWAASALAAQDRLVLLLDGLNEIPTAQRKIKANCITAYRRSLPETTPLILSCRRDDYVGDLRLDMDSLSLEPLAPQRVRTVLRHWLDGDAGHAAPGSADRLFWQLAGDERLAGVLETWLEAGATEDDFWTLGDPEDQKQAYRKTSGKEDEIWRRHIPDPRSLMRLAANPFMLTMLYVTWLRNDGELPRNRGELFATFIDSLLSREGLIRKDTDTGAWRRDARADSLIENLAKVATSMQLATRVWAHGEDIDPTEDYGVQTVIPKRDAVRILGGESMLKTAEDATLLEAADPIRVRFRHQLLQEYFTAIAMREFLAGGGLEAGRLWPAERWWERSGWEEAAVLLAGLYSDDCSPVLRWLQDAQPEVAAQCALESGAEIDDREARFRELHNAWLPRLADVEQEPQPEARAAVGRALGRLGLDDRKGVGLAANGLPDIDWVTIAGGEFLYQDGERRRIETFRIARYPVTNAQFRAFLEAEDGYRDDRWWRDLTRPDRSLQQPRWDIPNHPRERVSWFEAMAFCAWLSHKTELEVRLPTEWQWERAARGTDGNLYPWGGEYEAGRANINETLGDAGPHYLALTSAVGIYPQGASPEGVQDLSGNVWEWCLNEFDNPGRIQAGGDGSRVVRGGSWDLNQHYARAGGRDGGRPDGRGGDDGFRVLCASPIR